MKTKIIIFISFIVLMFVFSAFPCDECLYHTGGKAPDTFLEELVGLAKPLFVIGMFTAPPILIVLVLMGIGKAGKTGVKLTKDLLKDEDE